MALREQVHIEVNDETIAMGDPHAVIHPVWWTATIYDGPTAYERSLQRFSTAQRQVFAVLWYIAEVENGGHLQFYSNSTGIVWQDALDGFEAIGIPKAARILSISADRMGGSPSLDRQERKDQLEQLEADFDDCDEAFYALEERVDLMAAIMNFVRSQATDFYFSGTIERVVLPRH